VVNTILASLRNKTPSSFVPPFISLAICSGLANHSASNTMVTLAFSANITAFEEDDEEEDDDDDDSDEEPIKYETR